jgi:hypothetical protein
MTGPRRLLIAGLVGILVVLEVYALVGTILIAPRFAVDLEIPLRAAERWAAGGMPYLPSAFLSPPGATQPFLYPPYTLPFFAALGTIPREILAPVVVGLLLGIAAWTIRRLTIPWPWALLVLAWPPFAEAIYGANVQVVLFAAFVALFYRPGAGRFRPTERVVDDPIESDRFIGLTSTAIAAVKVSQLYAWVYVLRRRPRAAATGAIAVAVVVVATLPITGLQIWFDWVDQLRRGTDPAWDLGGFAAPHYLPPVAGPLIVLMGAAACLLVGRLHAGAWIGLISTVASASLHIFGLLFLIPAMLLIRIELVLMAAIAITTYSYVGAWSGIALVTVAFVLTRRSAADRSSSPDPGPLPASTTPGT